MIHGRYTGWGPKPMVAVDGYGDAADYLRRIYAAIGSAAARA
jgi:hypothetical protein